MSLMKENIDSERSSKENASLLYNYEVCEKSFIFNNKEINNEKINSIIEYKCSIILL